MLYVIGVYLARKNLILFCGGLYNDSPEPRGCGLAENTSDVVPRRLQGMVGRHVVDPGQTAHWDRLVNSLKGPVDYASDP